MKTLIWIAVGCVMVLCTPVATFAGSETFTTPGTYTFTVPEGVTSVLVKLWGAGGGMGSTLGTPIPVAGGGGYTTGSVTVMPGQALTVIIGEGGILRGPRTMGGGGAGYSDYIGAV